MQFSSGTKPKDAEDTSSIKTAIVERGYKPRPQTSAAYYLLALKRLSNTEQYITREEIKHFVVREYEQEKLKGLNALETNLAKHRYI